MASTLAQRDTRLRARVSQTLAPARVDTRLRGYTTPMTCACVSDGVSAYCLTLGRPCIRVTVYLARRGAGHELRVRVSVYLLSSSFEKEKGNGRSTITEQHAAMDYGRGDGLPDRAVGASAHLAADAACAGRAVCTGAARSSARSASWAGGRCSRAAGCAARRAGRGGPRVMRHPPIGTPKTSSRPGNSTPVAAPVAASDQSPVRSPKAGE